MQCDVCNRYESLLNEHNRQSVSSSVCYFILFHSYLIASNLLSIRSWEKAERNGIVIERSVFCERIWIFIQRKEREVEIHSEKNKNTGEQRTPSLGVDSSSWTTRVDIPLDCRRDCLEIDNNRKRRATNLDPWDSAFIFPSTPYFRKEERVLITPFLASLRRSNKGSNTRDFDLSNAGD